MQEKKEQILFLQFSSHTEEKFHPLIAKKTQHIIVVTNEEY